MIIYIDGGCKENPVGEAAWAALYVWNELQFLRMNTMGIASNNAAEVEAAIQALSVIPEKASVTVISDSMYLIGTMTQCWAQRTNVDRWARLAEVTYNKDIAWRHVKGHSGQTENQIVDWAVNKVLGRRITRIAQKTLDNIFITRT